ncbi:M56 family metallopeptidase [Streptomyces sp. NBC_01498]|uniref:M56 family metallopeptidase n=1 Tax=Streptomyces sp. NBC_01498 TaxID=2975870 RepID=UPI002E7B7BD0|nr:M56 family metallopeptidase [Streptomyces sp. NBC_01498]WTL28285.1 M56 family metallopeptidase [Streptomyces sp. NBC_01498]
MGVFVLLPLLLPLTALPVARLAERHLHPRVATRLLSALAAVLALCSTVCLGLLVVVGTVQLPGHPLPDEWAERETRTTAPYEEAAGKAAVVALLAVAVSWSTAARRHRRVRRRAEHALAGVPDGELAVLTDEAAYAYALPGVRDRPPTARARARRVRWSSVLSRPGLRRRSRRTGIPGGRVVVSTAMLACLDDGERAALLAHERAHLAGHHHRYLLTVRFAARANPLLRPLRSAVAYTTERWADEEAARVTGERRVVARAIGKAALVSRGTPTPTLAGFAAPGPVPRRVAALLEPAPSPVSWPSVFTAVGLAAWAAAAGTLGSALSSANATVTLFLVLKAGPL